MTDDLPDRETALAGAHVAPIERWRTLHHRSGRPLPRPDPLDGGVEARLLLLLESPGPGLDRARFVSSGRPTGSGCNLRQFLDAAGLMRRDVVIWTAVPWGIHAPGARNRAVRQGELRQGAVDAARLPRAAAEPAHRRAVGAARPRPGR